MKLENEYIIPFVGLKIGKHTFDFKITDSFFESFEYSIIHKGKVKVELLFEKKETMLIGNFTIDGVVVIDCDRCNDPLNVEISGEYQLIYKFDTKPSDDESLIVVYPEEYEIDVKENILELINVSLSYRNIHPEGECNEDLISILDEYILVTSDDNSSDNEDENIENTEEEYIDPRWQALKDLSKGKKK
ncbi:MAG: DUF177 domain-containing protein [Fluviicola sp.]|nr:DUF177 domain-containing protein [Fluviicola sp.]